MEKSLCISSISRMICLLACLFFANINYNKLNPEMQNVSLRDQQIQEPIFQNQKNTWIYIYIYNLCLDILCVYVCIHASVQKVI